MANIGVADLYRHSSYGGSNVFSQLFTFYELFDRMAGTILLFIVGPDHEIIKTSGRGKFEHLYRDRCRKTRIY